jgi:hypothetical protein
MYLKTVRSFAVLALAAGFLAPLAQAQEANIKEILVSVQNLDSKEIVAELREGDTLRLQVGDRVRLRLVAEPQGNNHSRHYPEGSFELHNDAGLVTLDNNPERGSAVVSAVKAVSRNKPDAVPFIRYVVTRPLKMDPRYIKGTLYVAVEAPVTQPTPAPPVVQPPPRPQDLPGITLYEHQDFRGRADRYTASDVNVNNNLIGADAASSIRVDPGCKVTLYEHPNYQGRATVFTQDETDLGRTRVGNDSVSSVLLDCSGARGNNTQGNYRQEDGRQEDRQNRRQDPRDRGYQAGVTLFEHQDFRGLSETFTADDPRLNDDRLRNDMASSVRVDPGCRVVLYEHPDFGGKASVLTDDEADLGRTRVGNDSVSSLEVRCDERTSRY